jgi:acyl-[acyl-carrier-protein]-phospholipid O-acyltransferase / long-chain-fatty-acid--[acyl-carrier-protein] ligase
MTGHPLQLLAARRFLPLFITQFLGALNDNIIKNALIILITYKLSQHSQSSIELLIVAASAIFILPFFLFSALAGQLADKYNKTVLIRLVKASEVAIILLAAVGFHSMHIPLLMLVIFLFGTHSAFFGPLKYAILPEHLQPEELIPGNSFIEAGTFIAILAGTLLGGLLILVDPYGAMLISAVGLLVAVTGLVSSLCIPPAKAQNPELSITKNIFRETWSILRYTAQYKQILMAILGISWFWLVGATFLSQFPTYTKDVLHGDPHIVTLFLTIFSVGIGVGSLLCNKLLDGEVSIKFIPAAAIGISIFGIDLYHASQYVFPHGEALQTVGQFLSNPVSWRIVFDLVAIAICGGIYIVPLYAFVQLRSDPDYRARVIAANNILNSLFMVVSAIIIAALLVMDFTIPQIFLTVALLNAVVAIYSVIAFPETLLKALFRQLFRLLYRIEVSGMEHYDNAGKRVLIIANHTSFLDAALLATFLPDKCVFAINSYIARLWWIRPFLGIVTALPVDPVNPMSTKSLIDVIKQDQKAVIFPEGRITVTGSLMKIYEGPGMVADKAGAALLPIRIDGAQYSPFSRMKHVQRKWFPKITITILPPRTFDIPEEMQGRKRREFTSRKLYDVMSDMMFETSNYQKTLFQSLIDASSIYGMCHAIIEDTERMDINYRQLLTRAFVLGRALSRYSLPGEFVALMLPSTGGAVASFFALQAYGRVPALLNFSAGASNLISACRAAAASTVVTSRKFIENAGLEPLVAQLAGHITILYLEDLKNEISATDKLKGALSGYFPQLAYNRTATGAGYLDPAVVLYTSGSEGIPKGVVLSHQNIQANRFQTAARIDFNAQDTVFNALPLFHSFGLTAGTLLPLLSGIKTFFYPSPLHYRIIPELVYDVNATILFGTDTFLAGYAEHAHPYDFYSVRYVFAGAERLKERTRSTWVEKFGIRIFEGYGVTETSPVLAVNTPMHYKHGTVGRIMPGIEWQLQQVAGIEEGGRLYVRGPNVLQGYLRETEPGIVTPLPESEYGEGWYDTGDIVTVDEEGFITIKGRAKRFAKIGGEMVSLTAVEEFISSLWPEAMHAVISVADEKKGEQLVLVTTEPQATREELLAQAKVKGISTLNLPARIICVETLPLLGSGKIDYMKLPAMVTVS